MGIKNIVAVVMLAWGIVQGVLSLVGLAGDVGFVVSSVWIVGAILLAWMPEKEKKE